MMEQYHGIVDELPNAEGNFIEGCSKKMVFGPKNFWPDYVMRCFILKPGAHSKTHTHTWPHYLFIHRGQGDMRIGEEHFPIEAGTWVYVPGNLIHGFSNTSKTEQLYVLCIVPPEGDVNPLLKQD